MCSDWSVIFYFHLSFCHDATLNDSGINIEARTFVPVLYGLLAHLSRRLIGELLVYRGIRRPSVRRPSVVRRQHFQTTSSLKPLGRFFSYFTYSIYR